MTASTYRRPGPLAITVATAGADTVYFHLYDVTDTEHIGLLGRDVVAQLT